MINLLSPATQKNFFLKRLRYALGTFGLFVAGILAVGFVFLTPSLIALRYLVNDLSYALGVEVRSPVTRALEERTQSLLGIESRAREMLARSPSPSSFEEVAADVMKVAPAGIDIATMRFEERAFVIEGRYLYRSSFLAFLETLKTRPLVKSVLSPLSNLLRETDASFLITLSL